MKRWLHLQLIKLLNRYLFQEGNYFMLAPVANTPRFNILLTADTGREYGLADNITTVGISYVNTPVGYSFRMWELRSGGWKLIGDEDDVDTNYSYVYGADVADLIAKVNAMGVKNFIQQKIAPWVQKSLETYYAGKIVGIVNAPGEVPQEVNAQNIVTAMNAGLMLFRFADNAGAKGVPELYPIG